MSQREAVPLPDLSGCLFIFSSSNISEVQQSITFSTKLEPSVLLQEAVNRGLTLLMVGVFCMIIV